jgi:hypothetical protein
VKLWWRPIWVEVGEKKNEILMMLMERRIVAVV